MIRARNVVYISDDEILRKLFGRTCLVYRPKATTTATSPRLQGTLFLVNLQLNRENTIGHTSWVILFLPRARYISELYAWLVLSHVLLWSGTIPVYFIRQCCFIGPGATIGFFHCQRCNLNWTENIVTTNQFQQDWAHRDLVYCVSLLTYYYMAIAIQTNWCGRFVLNH